MAETNSWEFDDISRAERALEREERRDEREKEKDKQAERFRIDGRQAEHAEHDRQGGGGGSECYKTPWDTNRTRHCAGDNLNWATQVVGRNWREAAFLSPQCRWGPFCKRARQEARRRRLRKKLS